MQKLDDASQAELENSFINLALPYILSQGYSRQQLLDKGVSESILEEMGFSEDLSD